VNKVMTVIEPYETETPRSRTELSQSTVYVILYTRRTCWLTMRHNVHVTNDVGLIRSRSQNMYFPTGQSVFAAAQPTEGRAGGRAPGIEMTLKFDQQKVNKGLDVLHGKPDQQRLTIEMASY